ncbi:MAG: V-type ATPase 116kDa subunit family protein [Chromatiaceae bacterium]
MLRPRPMKHVRLLVLTEDLPQASLALAQAESFHPDTRPPAESRLTGLPGRDYRDTYNQARSRLDKIAKLIDVPVEKEIQEVRVVELDELSALNDWLGQIWQKTSRYEEDLRRLDDQDRFVREQEAALENFQHLNIDLGMLRNRTRFLDFYVGIVPRENLRQLEGAVALADHLLHLYMQRGESAHVVIVGPTGTKETQLSAVLNAAGFQPIPIPDTLDETPEQIHNELESQRQDIRAHREAVFQRLSEWSKGFSDRLAEARRTLSLAEPLVTLDPSLHSAGHLAYLAGWVPARAVEGLAERLRETLALPFEVQARDPLPEERKLVPTVPVRSRFLQPFALLVKQYGVPEYGEVDPTPLFAVTFLLMFGSMFGDVGQGAVIAALGWYFRTRLGRFGLFGVMAGLSSVAFGFLYGSIFGYEDVLPALWMSPIHDPILMLKIALGYGVVFLVIACLLAIYNRVVIRNWSGAVFGHHGLVNLVFYLSLVWGGLNLGTRGTFGNLPTILVIASLGALAWYNWRHLEAPLGEKVLVVFIETLETIIGYVSNTLSFLRVAAFSLNHVALSIAVFTLANMMGAFGHILTVILGNLFVLVLEGGIVMIQVMRLQYYEGFSRYFSGDGHEFAPLRLRRGTAPS